MDDNNDIDGCIYPNSANQLKSPPICYMIQFQSYL